MKITSIICCLLSLFAISCANSQQCIDGINKLPMFGNVKKCKEQIDDDKTFIETCEKSPGRKAYAAHMVVRGWQYLHRGDLDTSTMRFNQAWLLDSLNAEIYWGFGDILGMQKKYTESIPYFEKALRLAPDSARIWQDASVSYGNAFFETKNQTYLNSTIKALKRSINIGPGSAALYSQLTAAYCYFYQNDSARNYLKITDKLYPGTINPEVRAMLSSK